MAERYILAESHNDSGIYGITDYFILDLEKDIIVEQRGFATFAMADAWYINFLKRHTATEKE